MSTSSIRLLLPLTVGSLLLVGAGCMGGGTATTGTQSNVGVDVNAAGVDVNAGGTVNVNSPRTIKVTARKFAFDPAEIRVKLGDTVKLDITSMDVTHGFALPDFNVNSTLTAGATTTVLFTADKKGTFPFFCSVYCGAGHGSMRGSLIVE